MASWLIHDICHQRIDDAHVAVWRTAERRHQRPQVYRLGAGRLSLSGRLTVLPGPFWRIWDNGRGHESELRQFTEMSRHTRSRAGRNSGTEAELLCRALTTHILQPRSRNVF